jgi:hypothetical protein
MFDETAVGRQLRINDFPSLLLINPEGVIIGRATNEADIKTLLAQVLKL